MTNSAEITTLEKVERLLEQMRDVKDAENLTIFDEAEADNLKELAKFGAEDIKHIKDVMQIMRGLEAIGGLGGYIYTLAKWIGAIGAVYVAFRTGVLEWLRANL